MAREMIGDLLVQMGYATQRAVEAALRIQQALGGDQRLGEILVERGVCDEEEVAKAVATQAGMKYCRISKFEIPRHVIALVPKEVAEAEQIVPLKVGKRALIVASESALDFFRLDHLRFQLGREVEAVIASSYEIGLAIERYYGARAYTRTELQLASGTHLVGGALSTLDGDISIELRADTLRLSGAQAGVRVRHELAVGGDLQQQLLDAVQLDASTLAAAQTGWRAVSLVRNDRHVDLLLRAFPVPGGRSLTLRRL